MGKRVSKDNINLRFNILSLLIYIVGIILIIQLFNLQIIKGEDYRNQSNTRLSRESTLEASRGDILDKTGNVLATNKMGFSLELYKTKIDTQDLNNTILDLVKVLEKNNQKYVDSFPITINPFTFTIDGDALAKWKQNNKMKDDATAEDCFYKFKIKYKIQNEDINEVRKIIAIRYEIAEKGYSSTRPLSIAKDVNRETIAQISERADDFPGINIVKEPIRTYTSGSLASHILGHVGQIDPEEYKEKKDKYDNNDIIGRAGIEYVFEDYLKGENGIKQIDMAVDGTVTAEYVSEEAKAGSNVILTIDANLQKVTEQALANNIQKISSGGFSQSYDTKAGSCVVMNVKTGEILAMASFPDYQPELFVGGITTENWNSYINNEAKPLRNKAIQDAYSPGSIFKMVSAIAGLESNAITANEKINDTGIYRYGNNEWKCWHYTDYHSGHGLLNVSGAIQHSCNFFFYETGKRMGIDTLVKYAKYFGLGSKTGVELSSESAGTLASRETSEQLNKPWNGGDVLNAVIGQGDNSFTPLQMVKYVSMLANGGKQIEPTIIQSVQNYDGTEVSKDEISKYVDGKLGLYEKNVENLQLKQENLNTILEGMKSVTGERGGTAYNIFKDFNIEVGGKTGSAEAGTKVNAWFAGFAPYNNPEIAIVVMVENGGHGNYTAEVVREIIAEYFGMNSDVKEDMTAIPYTEILN